MSRFDYFRNGVKEPQGAELCTPALFNEMLDNAKTEQIREGLAVLKNRLNEGKILLTEYENRAKALKMQLPCITPNASFSDGYRHKESAIPSDKLFVDVDHIPFPIRPWYEGVVAGREAELDVVFSALSIREEGLHFIKRRNPKLSREADAMSFCAVLGIADYLDKGTFNIDRCMYASTRSQVLYFDENELFSEEDYQEEELEDKRISVSSSSTVSENNSNSGFYGEIVKRWWEKNGGEPMSNVPNERHNRLVSLAAQLRNVIPDYGLDEGEYEQIIDWAASLPEGEISNEMKDIIREIKSEQVVDNQSNKPVYESLLTELIDHMPVGFRESLYGQPRYLWLPIISALGPVFGTFADQVSFLYDNGRPQYLMLMTLIIGHPGSGKGAVWEVANRFIEILFDEGSQAREADLEWRNSDDSVRPVQPRQLIGSNCTGAAMINLHNCSQGHTLLQADEELDAAKKYQEWCQNDDIYRKSFDRGMASVERSTKEAVSGMVRAQVNWLFCCTPNQPARLFDFGNSENGLFQRVLPAVLPDRRMEPWEKKKRFTPEECQMISQGTQEAIRRLRACQGYFLFDKLIDACENWPEKKRQELIKGNDTIMGLIARPTQILMRYAMLWWILSGEEEPSEDAIKFGIMMAEYMIAGQVALLQANIAKQAKTPLPQLNSNPHNLYDQLPQEFGMDELNALSPGTKTESVSRRLRRWVQERWIKPLGNQRWCKVIA